MMQTVDLVKAIKNYRSQGLYAHVFIAYFLKRVLISQKPTNTHVKVVLNKEYSSQPFRNIWKAVDILSKREKALYTLPDLIEKVLDLIGKDCNLRVMPSKFKTEQPELEDKLKLEISGVCLLLKKPNLLI